MAMETVPVAADVGGQRELVTPACGYLIPHGKDEIVQYVAALSELIGSPKKRRGMGQAGRRRICEHFTLDKMGNRMVEVLKRAQKLSRSHPRPPVRRGLGLEYATLAVEYKRIEELSHQLWRNRQQDMEYRVTSPVYAARQFIAVTVDTLKQAACHPLQFTRRVRQWIHSLSAPRHVKHNGPKI
jgi:hypothetical protein